MQIVRSFVLACAAALLCACSSLPKQLENAPPFAIGPDVKLPAEATYAGISTSISRITPLYRPLNPDGDTTHVLNDFMTANGIDLRPLLIDAFATEVRKTVAGSQLRADADHRIAFEVEAWGLGKPEGLSDITRAFIRMKVMLLDPTGTAIWERSVNTVGPDAATIPAKAIDEWLANPGALKAGFADAAALVCRKALANLRRAEGA